MNNRELLTVRDLAVDYAIPESSQRVFRQQKRFIPAYRVGRRLVYRRVDLEAWLSARAEDARDRTTLLAASRHIRSHDCGMCPPVRG